MSVPEADLDAVAGDVAALAAMSRGSAGAGERAAAAWAAGRLRAAGVDDVALEPYAGQRDYAAAHAIPVAAGVLAAARGGRVGALAALGALAVLEREVSGRSQALRRALPASADGANLVARVAPAAGTTLARRVVLVAHLDAARTAWIWDPRLHPPWTGRIVRRQAMDPVMAPVGAGFGLVAAGGLLGRRALRAAGGALLAAALAGYADVARGRTVPGANDNATGVAVALALTTAVAAAPLPGTELLTILTGSEEAGMGGMRAALRIHGAALRAVPSFVLGLDTLGSGMPIVARAEGALRAHPYAARDLALVDRGARRARAAPPQRWRVGAWTDPVLARHAGLRSASLLSVDAHGAYPAYHLPGDVPAVVDLASVAACAAIAAGTIAQAALEL